MLTDLEILAEKCGKGDEEAMLELSDYLRQDNVDGSNMWLLRAAIYGNKEAQERVMEIVNGDRIERMVFFRNMAIPYENFILGKRDNWFTKYSGSKLNNIGLLVFDPKEIYTVGGVSEKRHIQAGKYEGFDGPDEDGFGYEEYYSYFYLDEFFQPLKSDWKENRQPEHELWLDFLKP
ncbi:MAG: hypothetical protein LUH18_00905 [Oscillospiraceae bacterium]|nr:hypothetical protein [Oscillospiraceae bacterium]